MKFRTCLLAVCMVIVPTVAMFSHLIPAGTRGNQMGEHRDSRHDDHADGEQTGTEFHGRTVGTWPPMEKTATVSGP